MNFYNFSEKIEKLDKEAKINLSEKEREDIFYNNAKRFLKI